MDSASAVFDEMESSKWKKPTAIDYGDNGSRTQINQKEILSCRSFSRMSVNMEMSYERKNSHTNHHHHQQQQAKASISVFNVLDKIS